MGGEVEVLHFAASGDFAGAAAEYKCRAVFCRLEPAAGRVRVGVADEKNRLAFVADHAGGKVMRSGVFAHHPGGEDENAPAGEPHFIHLAWFEHSEVQRLGQLEVAVVAMGAVGFEIVNLREDAAQTADVNRLSFQFTDLHEQGEQGENFLRPAQREGGNEHATPAFENLVQGRGEALDFGFTRKTGRHLAVAPRGFHDEHIGLHVAKARAAQNGQVAETDVAGVKEGFLLPTRHNPGGAEGVAGVVEFQCGRSLADAGLVRGSPFDFTVVAEPLKQRGDFIHFVMRKERIFLDAQFVALTGHDVHGIVQHAFDEEVAQFGHQDVRLGKMAQHDRQRTDMVVMTMSDSDGVEFLFRDQFVERQTFAALALGVSAGVQQHPMPFDFDEPGAGADVRSGIEVEDSHGPPRNND